MTAKRELELSTVYIVFARVGNGVGEWHMVFSECYCWLLLQPLQCLDYIKCSFLFEINSVINGSTANILYFTRLHAQTIRFMRWCRVYRTDGECDGEVEDNATKSKSGLNFSSTHANSSCTARFKWANTMNRMQTGLFVCWSERLGLYKCMHTMGLLRSTVHRIQSTGTMYAWKEASVTRSRAIKTNYRICPFT